ETSVTMWAQMEIPIRECTNVDQLINLMIDKAREIRAAFDGKTTVRCTICGNGPLHRDLQRDAMSEELRDVLESEVATESVRIATGPELDFESLTRGETLVSDFLKLGERALENPELRQRLAETVLPLFRRRGMPLIDDRRLCEWIERAAALGVDLLL